MAFIGSFYHLSVTTFHTLHNVEDWVAHRCNLALVVLSADGGEFRLTEKELPILTTP
jgi:hypothetical protein